MALFSKTSIATSVGSLSGGKVFGTVCPVFECNWDVSLGEISRLPRSGKQEMDYVTRGKRLCVSVNIRFKTSNTSAHSQFHPNT